MKKNKTYKPSHKFNKRYFQQRGVIFEREQEDGRNAIVMCHWPHCGMDAKTARKLASWLLKRADEMDTEEEKKRV